MSESDTNLDMPTAGRTSYFEGIRFLDSGLRFINKLISTNKLISILHKFLQLLESTLLLCVQIPVSISFQFFRLWNVKSEINLKPEGR